MLSAKREKERHTKTGDCCWYHIQTYIYYLKTLNREILKKIVRFFNRWKNI